MTAPETFTPRLGEVIVPRSGDLPDNTPIPTAPYFRLYDQGYFLHKPVAFGHGIVPAPKRPTTLAKIENPKGIFFFEGPRVTANIIAQAVDFFRRILREKDSEAEVLITQNWETRDYRLFVPTQYVSRGGVRSIYNPAHIAQGYLVVGTIHSHCDFSARHSGIDEGDARDMDGIHLTIGMLQREQPEIDAFIAMNKTFFQYEPDVLAETDDLTAGTAPVWWDRYVFNRQPTDADRPAYADDKTWDRIMGRNRAIVVSSYNPTTRTMQPINGRETNHTQECLAWVGKTSASDLTGDDWNAYLRKIPVGKPRVDFSTWEPEDWLVAMEYGWVWVQLQADGAGRYFQADEVEGAVEAIAEYRAKHTTAPRMTQAPHDADEHDEDDERLIEAAEREAYAQYWEDVLDHEFVDSLYTMGLVDDGDIDAAIEAGDDSLTPEYWIARMRAKMQAIGEWLEDQGYEVSIRLKLPKNQPLPGQTEAFPLLPGTTTPSTERPPKGAHV